MSRKLRRGIVAVLVCGTGGFFVLCWFASSRLICPARRTVQDYHREILDHARDHGMVIHSLTLMIGGWAGTPCLVCEPVADPGAAQKGNRLRSELAAQNVALQPWGKISATAVLLHGHTGRKEDHLPVAERFCAAGFRCILIDLPGHGDHPQPFASFGFREAALPAAALSEIAAVQNFDPQPAVLFGISQGGAIALQAAAAGQGEWAAVAELSAFAALDEVITNQAARLFGPLHVPAEFVVTQLVRWRAGYDPAQVRPIDAAAGIVGVPVLIGHGSEDTFVPADHARRLLSAVGTDRKQFLAIDGAGHHDVLVTAQPVYATICGFLLRAINGQNKN